MTTVQAALAEARRRGVAGLDAQLLLARLLDVPRTGLLAADDRVLDAPQLATWTAQLARRAAGEPLAYLLGEKEFYGLALEVGPAVLVPRPETELLVDWALELLAADAGAGNRPRILDLGTGSGAVALAIASRAPLAEVTATDVDAAALAVARRNAARLGRSLELVEGPWWAPLAGRRFELVVCNPPYVGAADRHLDALRHEPIGALTPGDDALSAIAAVVGGAADHLEGGGWLLVEHGHEQGDAVRSLFAAAGFEQVGTRCDLAGWPRTTGGRRGGATTRR